MFAYSTIARHRVSGPCPSVQNMYQPIRRREVIGDGVGGPLARLLPTPAPPASSCEDGDPLSTSPPGAATCRAPPATTVAPMTKSVPDVEAGDMPSPRIDSDSRAGARAPKDARKRLTEVSHTGSSRRPPRPIAGGGGKEEEEEDAEMSLLQGTLEPPIGNRKAGGGRRKRVVFEEEEEKEEEQEEREEQEEQTEQEEGQEVGAERMEGGQDGSNGETVTGTAPRSSRKRRKM